MWTFRLPMDFYINQAPSVQFGDERKVSTTYGLDFCERETDVRRVSTGLVSGVKF